VEAPATDIRSLPKVELHVHLDTSLTWGCLSRIEPGMPEALWRQRYAAPRRCHSLAEFLRHTDPALHLLQSERNLRIAMDQLVQELHGERVLYAEIRFAPLLHLQGDMDLRTVARAACEAMAEACAETGMEARLLFCTLRHFSLRDSMRSAELALEFHGHGVAGFDLASDEAAHGIDAHELAFRLVAEEGMPATAHAGEARGPDSVREVLEGLGVRRIGHGVRSWEDPALVERLARERIHLEVCPGSNLQTGVFPSMEAHPVDRLYRAGVPLGINTDGRGLCDTTLAREYGLLGQTFGWDRREFLECNRMALEAAFCGPEMRQRLLAELERGYTE